jgi:hypothetical protein
MALSTVTIQDSINFVKWLNFGRNPVIGNSLEPALTSANMVMQTILGPPFSWWWNNQEVAFTCSSTAVTSAITNVALTSNIVTLTTANAWKVGDLLMPSALVTATFLNGQILAVVTASATQITAAFVHANYGSAADTGTLTNTTTQDYTVAAPEFSHIEHASVLDITQTPSKWYELKVEDTLSLDTIKARPGFINPHVEDSDGNITFRVMPSPNANYPVSLHLQTAAPLITSMNQTWSPLPDYMQYVYNWGFLTLMWFYADDSRAGFANSKFTAGLLARAEGLTEQERNIFLNNWNNLTGAEQMKIQQGTQARSV